MNSIKQQAEVTQLLPFFFRKIGFIVALFLLVSVQSKAQNNTLLLIREASSSYARLPMGVVIKCTYDGYLGQAEKAKGTLISSTDSSLVIEETKLFRKKKVEILLTDITGLRIYPMGRLLGQAVYRLVVLAASVTITILAPQLALSYWAGYALSSGTAIGGLALERLFFSEKVQIKRSDGWKVVSYESKE